jgi:hypothetical protein
MNNLVAVEVKQQLGTIESNLDAVKASITERLSVYKTMAVSEDTIADSKKLVAELRKSQKSLDDQRKSIKNSWNAPYLDFEKQAKEVIALYDEPISLINSQLSQFEEDRRAAKKLVIQSIYEECASDLSEYLTIDKIYNPKWENATYSEKNIREDIQTQCDRISMEISTIKALDSEFEAQGLEKYKLTLDLTEAVDDMSKRKKMKEEILEQERKKAEEEAKKKAEEEVQKIEEEARRLEEESKNLVKAAEQVDSIQHLPSYEDDLEAPFVSNEPCMATVLIPEGRSDEFKSLMIKYGFEYRMES